MEVVETGEDVEGTHGVGDAPVPLVVADTLAGRVAEVLVVGLAVVQRVVGELQVRGESPS